MPLTLIGAGSSAKIRKISGNDETKRYLGNLGFVAGSEVEVLNSIGGSLIVKVKDSRIALNEDMARHIMI